MSAPQRPHRRLDMALPRVRYSLRSPRRALQHPAAHTADQAISSTVHVYAISDLHCDHDVNMQWVRDLCASRSQTAPSFPRLSVLLVAGDVSSKVEVLRDVLTLLKSVFWQVVFVPGNHELWVTGRGEGQDSHGERVADSLGKLAAVRRLCDSLGVHTGPVRVGQLFLVPLLSWHHKSFDHEPDIPGNLVPKASRLTISDYARCVWPPPYSQLGSVELAHLLDQLNDECESVRLIETLQTTQAEQTEGNSAQPDRGPMQTSHGKGLDDSSSTSSSGTTACTVADNGISGGSMSVSSTSACAIASGVITVSHFLPSQSLLPEKRFLMYPNLAKAVGSRPLGERVKSLRPAMHVFGHTHFAWDDAPEDMGGVRCIQAPLCYPQERKRRIKSIRMHSDWQPLDTSETHTGDATWLPVLIAKAHCTLHPVPDEPAPQQATDAKQNGSTPQPASSSTSQHEQLAAADTRSAQQASSSSSYGSEVMSAGTQRRTRRRVSRQEVPDVAPPQGASAVPAGEAWQHLTQRMPCLLEEHFSQQQTQSVAVHAAQQQGTSCTAMQSLQAASVEGTPSVVESRWQLRSWRLELCPDLDAMWSAYYKTHARDPANTELAWWVAQRYEKVAARLKRQEIAAVGRGARTGRLGDGSSADDEDLSNPELTEAE